MRSFNFSAVALLAATLMHASPLLAQYPYSNAYGSRSAAGTVEERLDALESRMDRLEVIVTRLAEVSANLAVAVDRRGPPESVYRQVAFRQERTDPPMVMPPSSTLPNGETGRVVLSTYGDAQLRLALPGGGYLAAGNSGGLSNVNSNMLQAGYGEPVRYVPTYYTKRAEQIRMARGAYQPY